MELMNFEYIDFMDLCMPFSISRSHSVAIIDLLMAEKKPDRFGNSTVSRAAFTYNLFLIKQNLH